MRAFRLLIPFLVLAVSSTGPISSVLAGKGPNECDKFELVPGSFTWSQARIDAVLNGGRLASVLNEVEQGCVASEVSILGESSAWIGGSDGHVEGLWRWVGGIRPRAFWIGDQSGFGISFSHWAGAQPDDFFTGEDCLEMRADNGQWNDQSCNETRAYVIQYR